MFRSSWSRRLVGTLSATFLVLGTVALASPAQAHGSKHKHKHHALGERSLATVLLRDKKGFDHNGRDYDILTGAVLAVLGADADSPVKVLLDGKQPLTAFLPNDRAFRRLANEALGRKHRSESTILNDLAGALGVPAIEQVLLYHVVPGATVDYRTALRSDGAKLKTAAGPALTVDVKRYRWWKYVTLVDGDRKARNARVVRPNINKGNKQIAHGINRVLRLPSS